MFSRILKLDAGLVCSCLPAVFVFLKRFAKSDSRSGGNSQGQDNKPGHI